MPLPLIKVYPYLYECMATNICENLSDAVKIQHIKGRVLIQVKNVEMNG
jgi:hypothetical protein